MTAEEIFKRFASRIVFLTCEESANETGQGSGVLVSADGFIVTNAHVVGRCQRMTAMYIKGALQRSYEPAIKYYDEQSDTAVLKIPDEGLDFFGVIARPVRIGERVYAIGNPRGLVQSISEGIVSGNREENGVPWIQHSAPISPGSSGGALISSRGELLGINSYTKKESQNLNFALPAATLAMALSGARDRDRISGFPELTGTYSGVVLNVTGGISANFKIVVAENKSSIHGCMAVNPPLIGSGYLRGTTHDPQFSFVVVSDAMRLSFDGQRNANNLSGTYSVSPPDGGSEQNGTFVLHKTSVEGPSSGFNIQNCPNDATVTREAAEQGNASAQLSLGLLYYKGKGVPQDYAQAVAWLRKAAEQENAEAQTSLGVLYQMGQGVPQDYAQAAAWYRKAAEQSYATAQYGLGVLYTSGYGVPKDYSEAYFWVKLAAAGKITDAKPEQLGALLDEIATHLTTAALSQALERTRKWLAAQPQP